MGVNAFAHQLPSFGAPTLVVIAALVLVVFAVSWSGRGGRQRDPRRAFTTAERLRLFARAGNRCEYKPIILPRCVAAPTHADHIYPWSRGGATSISNGQALCARHNLAKSNWVPTVFYIRRLERRRRSYFPPGERVEIVYRIGGRP